MKPKKKFRRSCGDARLRKKPLPPLRPLPACVDARKPGEKLTNSDWIELLQWGIDCLNDASRAAGLRK